MYLVKKKRKKGYVLLQTIIILFFISFISLLINKTIINNVKKSQLYLIKADIRVLDEEYEEFLYEATGYVNSNEKIIQSLIEKNDNDKLGIVTDKFTYEYKFSKKNSRKIVINNEKIYIQDSEVGGSRFSNISYKINKCEENQNLEIILLSDYYKTGKIIGL